MAVLYQKAREYGEQPEIICQNFARAATSAIVPTLLHLLTKQVRLGSSLSFNFFFIAYYACISAS